MIKPELYELLVSNLLPCYNSYYAMYKNEVHGFCFPTIEKERLFYFIKNACAVTIDKISYNNH